MTSSCTTWKPNAPKAPTALPAAATKVDLGFTIEYTQEAEAMMDDRMILKTDVVRVLQTLRETGEAIRDEETGLLLTRARLGNVTFWVKYEEIDGGYRVHRAYSHRMNIVNRL